MYKLICVFLIALSGCFAGNVIVAETSNDKTPLSAIQQNSTLNHEAISSVIPLGTIQVAHYQNLELRLIDIEDSRCATGETCFWAGQIVVTLEVTNEAGEKVAIKLIRKREAEIAYAFGFSLLLLDVAPHPKKGKVIQLSDQTVTLQLEKVM
ncbi:hypothetical protein [uncultured Paraglaciecola sp.]|uniref:hypothetical protein n=1 Tax=uncultured Paraglaciecola sp. TaxID=1765024 RepID=UPI0030D7956C|tara:strand:- start:64147 stop:64602 length:456 start_codon:yes stop_codon:yes gene_type:complete